MSEENRLGNNIRRLREARGITQETLADQLHLAKSAISNYENGLRIPDMETLKRIASYFGETADRFLNGDYSYLEKGELRITKEKLASGIKTALVMYPIHSSEKALRNQHFKKAYDAHIALRETYSASVYLNSSFQELHRSQNKSFQESYTGYAYAMEDPDAELEAMANQISLLFMCVSYHKVPHELVKTGSAIVEQLKQINDEKWRRRVFEELDFLQKKDSDEPETFSVSFSLAEITEMLISLKKSGDLADLADYYLALTYFLGLANSTLGYELSHRIGIEMLRAFCSVHNQYAERFFAVDSEASSDISSQTVDDKA